MGFVGAELAGGAVALQPEQDKGGAWMRRRRRRALLELESRGLERTGRVKSAEQASRQ